MKYGILSDIHANLEALETVMDHAKSEGVKRFLCLGDIVGYNADPEACVDIIRDLNCPVVLGNHDAYTIAEDIPSAVNGRARESLEWTRNNVREDQLEWLASLPMTARVGPIQIVHASLHDPEQWNYVLNSMESMLHFNVQEETLCFYGHTHNPMYFTTAERKAFKDFDRIEIDPEHKYLVNTGSVGQPRSKNRRAQYAVYDTRAKVVEFHRLDYDVATTCKKIREAGLPEHNALRLEKSDIDAAEALRDEKNPNALIDSLK